MQSENSVDEKDLEREVSLAILSLEVAFIDEGDLDEARFFLKHLNNVFNQYEQSLEDDND